VKRVLLTAVALLAGCGFVSESQWTKAAELCRNDDGVKYAEPESSGVTAYCKNGATYSYRKK
jgi:hypothetical protein